MKNKKCFKIIALVLIFSLLMGTTVCAKGNSAAQTINSAALMPQEISSPHLANMINQVFGQILTDDMTTYDQVKACYDWLIVNTEYGFSYREEEDFNLEFATYSDGLAYMVLKNHVGDCIGYATALEKMLKVIGLDCHVQYGMTHTSGGDFTTHAWLVVVIDGIEYIFDPQIEDNIAKGGAIGYHRFCKTYGAVPGKYLVGEAASQYAVEAGFIDFYNRWFTGVVEQENGPFIYFF